MKVRARFSFLLFLVCAVSICGVLASELPDFTELVNKYSPAVVKIQVEVNTGSGQVAPGLPPGQDLPEPFRRFFQMPEDGAGSVLQEGLGSGFIIDTDGYILTNHHVVNGADRITVRMNDRREFDAEVVGSDVRSDLALLKIQASGLPTLHLASSDNLKVGEWVLAIGSPFGLDYSVSAGIVSAMGRSLPNERNENYVPFIQTDVMINPGNSGGPLFNLAGDVVGINSQIFTKTGGAMGLSFAIPASVARNVVSQLKEHGVVARGWLGVSIQEVDKELAESFGLKKPEGALVAQVMPDGPAEKGGILPGDIITSFNGKKILFSSDLPHLVGEVAPGTTASLVLMRNGKQKSLELAVGELPDNNRQLAQRPGSKTAGSKVDGPLGLQLGELDASRRKQLQGGVLVQQVRPGGAADKAGLQPGDVIVQLGFSPVSNVTDFRKVAASLPVGSVQPIRFYREGTPVFRSIIID